MTTNAGWHFIHNRCQQKCSVAAATITNTRILELFILAIFVKFFFERLTFFSIIKIGDINVTISVISDEHC